MLARHPAKPGVWNYFLLGLLLESQGKTVGAAQVFAKAEELVKQWPLLDFHLGRRALAANNSKGAIHYLERALTEAPDWQEACVMLANAYAQDGQHDRALD